MSRHILVFYGSYRRDRQGIKLANWIVDAIKARGDSAELIDAKAVDLPMLDRRFSDYAPGDAPPVISLDGTRNSTTVSAYSALPAMMDSELKAICCLYES